MLIPRELGSVYKAPVSLCILGGEFLRRNIEDRTVTRCDSSILRRVRYS